jgi:hypothetical protein
VWERWRRSAFRAEAQAFEAGEEEGAVVAVVEMRNGDGTAESAAEVVHDDLGLGAGEGVAGVEGVFSWFSKTPPW